MMQVIIVLMVIEIICTGCRINKAIHIKADNVTFCDHSDSTQKAGKETKLDGKFTAK